MATRRAIGERNGKDLYLHSLQSGRFRPQHLPQPGRSPGSADGSRYRQGGIRELRGEPAESRLTPPHCMTVRETKENEMSILSLEAERFLRLFIDVCPFKLGHRVTINPTNQYAADWPGVYIITRMQWD
jgi:hypothetical protein